MGTFWRAALGAATMFGLGVSATAQAACWSPAAADAAKVREFETMLMVSALRCRHQGINFLPEYNRFIKGNRAQLTRVNDTLRSHFSAGVGAKAGLNRYDSYVTTIANRYGAGADGLDCGDMRDFAHKAVATRSADDLAALADRSGADPRLPGGVCRGVKVARSR